MSQSAGGGRGPSKSQRGRNRQVAIVVASIGAAAVVIAAVIGLWGHSTIVNVNVGNSHSSAPSTGAPVLASPSNTTAGNLVTLSSPEVDTVAYSFDGNYLAAGNANGLIRVWRTSTWKVVNSMTDTNSRGVNSVAFNPANSLLAAGDTNGHVYVWKNGHATILSTPSGTPIRSVAFSQDNKYLAACDAGGTVNVWRTSTWRRVSSMTDPGSSGVNSVAFNPANSLLAAGDANGHIYLWASGHATALKDPFGAAVRSVLFTADNKALVSGNSAGYVYVWHVGSGEPWLRTFPPSRYNVAETLLDPHTKGIESVAFNASTTVIAAADGNGRVYLWLFKHTPKGYLQYPTSNAALSVAYSPDGNHLAVASADGNVYVKLVNS